MQLAAFLNTLICATISAVCVAQGSGMLQYVPRPEDGVTHQEAANKAAAAAAGWAMSGPVGLPAVPVLSNSDAGWQFQQQRQPARVSGHAILPADYLAVLERMLIANQASQQQQQQPKQQQPTGKVQQQGQLAASTAVQQAVIAAPAGKAALSPKQTPESGKPQLQAKPAPQAASDPTAARLAQVEPIDEGSAPVYDDYDDQQLPAPLPEIPDSALSAPLYITPQSSFESLTEVNVDQPLLQIPQSFLGISHEWTHVEEINNIPGYKDIIKLLTSYGSGPFNIRIGGGSTDKQAYVFPQYVYEALREVHNDTGAQFIIGVNFEKGDVNLTRTQIKIAQATLPPEAIQAFELGNEPNYYEGTKNNLTAMQYVRCCFVQDWSNFAKALSCPCGSWDCCTYGQFAGPVWGHINIYPTTLKWFLDANHKFSRMTTLHWYKATKETYNTPVTLLDEAPIRKEMDNLRALVQTSLAFGLPLRIAEMNTISNSGRVGVSNVFAATLWTLDGAFEVAAAGAVGVNFHQGSGQNLYTSILRWYNQGKLSPPVLRPPFYGMLMFQQAVGSGSQLLGKTQVSGSHSSFKVWPLLHTADGELRFVVINKHSSKAGVQKIRVKQDSGYENDALVTRLVARGEDPLSATSGITLGGYYFAVGGVQKGEDASELAPVDSSSGLTVWNIYMPPGSAALVRIKPEEAKRKLL